MTVMPTSRRAIFGLPLAALTHKRKKPPMGWQQQDQVTASIVIIEGSSPGVFVYNGLAGPGNAPIAWVANGPDDPFGNSLPASTIATQNKLLGLWSALNNGSLELGSSTNFAPATIAPATAQMVFSSPQQTNIDTAGTVQLDSAAGAPAAALGQQTFETIAGTLLLANSGARVIGNTETDTAEITTYADLLGGSTPASAANRARLYGNANASPAAINPSGYTGTLPLTQTDTATYTAASTSFLKMSNIWHIPANDAQNGTTYRLIAQGSGTQGGTQQILELQVNAFGLTGLAPLSMAAATIPAGAAFRWYLTVDITVVANGVSGTINVDGLFTWSASGVAVTTANSDSAAFGQDAISVNTTTTSNITLQMAWANTLGLPTATSVRNDLERTGP